MARLSQWSDEYWLLLMQLYLKKPTGLKPLYHRDLVDLALELHIRPQFLHQQMFRLRQLDTPRMEKLWQKYSKSPKKLAAAIKHLREMKGFGQAGDFYNGVEVVESWEKDFKPLASHADLTIVKLILILDLYFRLTPITMVAETPEVIQLGKRLKVAPATIVEVMDVFMFCDPYLNRDDLIISPLLPPCQEVWQRYGDNPEKLEGEAAQLLAYF